MPKFSQKKNPTIVSDKVWEKVLEKLYESVKSKFEKNFPLTQSYTRYQTDEARLYEKSKGRFGNPLPQPTGHYGDDHHPFAPDQITALRRLVAEEISEPILIRDRDNNVFAFSCPRLTDIQQNRITDTFKEIKGLGNTPFTFADSCLKKSKIINKINFLQTIEYNVVYQGQFEATNHCRIDAEIPLSPIVEPASVTTSDSEDSLTDRHFVHDQAQEWNDLAAVREHHDSMDKVIASLRTILNQSSKVSTQPIHSLEDKQKLVNNLCERLTKTIQKLNLHEEELTRKIAELNYHQNQFLDQYESDANKITGLEEELANTRATEEKYRTDLTALLETNSKLLSDNEGLKESEEKLRSILEKLTKQDAESSKKITELNTIIDSRETLLNNITTELVTTQTSLEQQITKTQLLEKNKSEYKIDIARLNAELLKLNLEINTREEEHAKKLGALSDANQAISTNHDAEITKLKQKQAETLKSLQQVESDIASKQSQLEQANTDLAILRSQMSTLTQSSNQETSKLNQALSDQVTHHRKMEETLEAKTEELTKVKTELTKLNEDIALLKSTYQTAQTGNAAAIATLEETHQKALEELTSQANTKQREIDTKTTEIKEMKVELTQSKAEATRLNEIIEKLEDQLATSHEQINTVHRERNNDLTLMVDQLAHLLSDNAGESSAISPDDSPEAKKELINRLYEGLNKYIIQLNTRGEKVEELQVHQVQLMQQLVDSKKTIEDQQIKLEEEQEKFNKAHEEMVKLQEETTSAEAKELYEEQKVKEAHDEILTLELKCNDYDAKIDELSALILAEKSNHSDLEQRYKKEIDRLTTASEVMDSEISALRSVSEDQRKSFLEKILDFDSKLKKISAENEQYDVEADQLHETVKTLKQIVSTNDKRIADLESSKSALEKDKNELIATVVAITNNLTEAENKLLAEQKKIKKVTEDLESNKRELTGVQEKAEELEEKLQKLKVDLGTQKSGHEDRIDRIQTSHSNRLDEMSKVYKTDLDTLTAAHAQQIKDILADQAKLLTTQKGLNDKSSEYINALNQSSAKVKQLEDDLKKQSDKIQELEQKSTSSLAEKDQLTAEVNTLKTTQAELIASHETAVRHAEGEVERHKEAQEALRTEMSQLTTNLHATKAELENVKLENGTLTARVTALTVVVKEKTEELESTKAEMTELKINLSASHQNVAGALRAMEQLTETLKETERLHANQVTELEARIAKINLIDVNSQKELRELKQTLQDLTKKHEEEISFKEAALQNLTEQVDNFASIERSYKWKLEEISTEKNRLLIRLETLNSEQTTLISQVAFGNEENAVLRKDLTKAQSDLFVATEQAKQLTAVIVQQESSLSILRDKSRTFHEEQAALNAQLRSELERTTAEKSAIEELLTNKINALTEEKVYLTNEVGKLTESLQRTNAALQEERTKAQLISDALESNSAELIKANAAVHGLETKIKEQEAAHQVVVTALGSQYQGDLDAYQAEMTRLTDTHAAQLRRNSEERDALILLQAELLTKANDLNSKLSDTSVTVDVLTNRVEGLVIENTALTKRLEAAQTESQASSAENELLRGELTKQAASFAELSALLSNTHLALTTANQAKTKQTSEMNTLTKEMTRLKVYVTEVERENFSLKSQVTNVTNENELLQVVNSNLTADLLVKEELIAKQKSQIAHLSGIITEQTGEFLNNGVGACTSRVDFAQGGLSAFLTVIGDMLKRIEDLEAENKASKSQASQRTTGQEPSSRSQDDFSINHDTPQNPPSSSNPIPVPLSRRFSHKHQAQTTTPSSPKWDRVHNVDARKVTEAQFELKGSQKVLLAINYPSTNLTLDEVNILKTTGLKVHSSSGMHFILSAEKGVIPKAVLTADGAKPIKDEDDCMYKQRLARTIIDMVDNVLSKGDVVKINTTDPFKAEIVELYIKHLKEIDNDLKTITFENGYKGTVLSDEEKKGANEIFKLIGGSVKLEALKQAEWYKDHKELIDSSPRHSPDSDRQHNSAEASSNTTTPEPTPETPSQGLASP